MRGCISAGMVGALYYLGLEDTFDVIYGSSAGTIIGAYFNTRQLPTANHISSFKLNTSNFYNIMQRNSILYRQHPHLNLFYKHLTLFPNLIASASVLNVLLTVIF